MKTISKVILVILAMLISVFILASLTSEASAEELISIKNFSLYDKYGSRMYDRDSTYAYTGKPVTPFSFLMNSAGKTIEHNEVICRYRNNTKIGIAELTVSGRKDKGYKDTLKIRYNIKKRKKGSAPLPPEGRFKIAPIPDQVWTGNNICPSALTVTFNGTRLVRGSTYNASYENCINCGTARVTATGLGKYARRKTSATYKIVKADIGDMTVSTIPAYRTTGSQIKPSVKVYWKNKLVPASSYSVSYANNITPGTATITLTGKGNNVKGKKTVTFQITDTFADATVETIQDQPWTGNQVTPLPIVKIGNSVLKEGSDYFLSYKNNVEASASRDAICIITPKGAFEGEASKEVRFRIAMNLSEATISLPHSSITYTGEPIAQVPTLQLGGRMISNSNFSVKYSDNTNVGTAIVTAKAKEDSPYMHSISARYEITQANIADATITGIPQTTPLVPNGVKPSATLTYNGKTLANGRDYTVSYLNNTGVGLATVVFNGIGNFTGQAKTTFYISPAE